MGQLSFSASKFTVNFANTPGFEASTSNQLNRFVMKRYVPIQGGIELLAAGGDSKAFLANLTKLCSCYKSTLRLLLISVALMGKFNEPTQSNLAAVLIFSTLISDRPLILRSFLVVLL